MCVQLGFRRSGSPQQDAAAYLSGAAPELLDHYPELGMLRDVAFYASLLLCPSADGLPQHRAWEPRDAALRWSSEPEGGEGLLALYRGGGQGTRLVANGFGRRLTATRPAEPGVVARLLQAPSRPRAPPSAADTEALLGPGVRTEDDVLHVPNERLPAFGGRLGPSDSELLCQILTAPYLRIPLLVDFLREDGRLRALEDPSLQAIADACLFEPGPWRPPEPLPSLPEAIPAAEQALRASPCGLLVNELVHAPQPLLEGVAGMLERALDFDTGSHEGPSAQAVLYVIRLAVRVEDYAAILAAGIAPGADELGGLGIPTGVWAADVADKVLAVRRKLVGLLRGRALTTLEGWRGRLVKAERLGEACEVLAHMALIFTNADAQADVSTGFDGAAARALLACQLYLTNNFAFGLEDGPGASAAASPPDTESLRRSERVDFFFGLVQRHRRHLLDWIEAGPARRTGAVLENVIAVLTTDAKLTVTATPAGCPEETPRRWASLPGPDCKGRLCPDTETEGYTAAVAAAASGERDFEGWLQTTTRAAVGTEVNLQLGTFTMQSNERELLNSRFTAPADFSLIVGSNASQRLQCTRVLKTAQCEQVRLMFRHDLHYWEADHRTPRVAFSLFCIALPDWVSEGIARLPKSICPAGLMFEDLSGDIVRAQVQNGSTLLEVAFFKTFQGTHVNVFRVVSHGRRFLRSILFSSSPIHCLHDLAPSFSASGDHAYEMPCGQENLAIADDPAFGSGLVITRALSKDIGEQVFVPRRYLEGLLPSSLLGACQSNSYVCCG